MSVADQTAANPSKLSQLITEIRLAPQFVNRICARLETAEPRDAGVSGLLYGTQYGPMVVVQAFRSLLETDAAAIEAGQKTVDEAVRELARIAQRDASLDALDPIGWYSFRTAAGLSGEDAGLHEREFPDNSQIALLVRRGDGAFLLFDFYARSEEGLLTTQQHCTGNARFSPAQATTAIVDVPLRNRIDRAHAAAASARAIPATARLTRDTAETERAGLPAVVAPDRPPSPRKEILRLSTAEQTPPTPAPVGSGLERARMRVAKRHERFPWLFPVLLFTAAAAITFAFLLLPGISLSHSAANSAFNKTLNLHVETQGERVLLTWNRNNPVVKTASQGVLHIDDGNLHRDVQLDGAQVANGAVLYKPNSDDVNFRLQVQGQNSNTVAENLRLLDGTGPTTQATNQGTNVPGGIAPAAAAIPTAQQPLAPPHSETLVAAPQQKAPSVPETKDLVAATGTPALTPSVQPAAKPVEVSHPADSPAPSQTPSATVQNAIRNPPPLSAPLEIPTLQPDPAPAQIVERAAVAAPPTPIAPAEKAPTPKQEIQVPVEHKPEPEQVTPAPQVKQPALAPTAQATTAARPFAQRYVPPKPTKQVLPNISALPTSLLNGASRVSVLVVVDETGRVIDVHPQASPQKVPRPIVQAAETAARQWTFQPASLDGKPVPSEHSIVFQFGR